MNKKTSAEYIQKRLLPLKLKNFVTHEYTFYKHFYKNHFSIQIKQLELRKLPKLKIPKK